MCKLARQCHRLQQWAWYITLRRPSQNHPHPKPHYDHCSGLRSPRKRATSMPAILGRNPKQALRGNGSCRQRWWRGQRVKSDQQLTAGERGGGGEVTVGGVWHRWELLGHVVRRVPWRDQGDAAASDCRPPGGRKALLLSSWDRLHPLDHLQ